MSIPNEVEKPFVCEVPGCEVRSESQYGITMHTRLKHPTPAEAQKRAEAKRVRDAARLVLVQPDDLFRRSGAALDLLFPKITGEMVTALAKLQQEMIETMQRER